jgi:hypothetical protein
MSSCVEMTESGPIVIAPFTLVIRSKGTATVRTFRPTQAQPTEVFQHRRDKIHPVPGGVQVVVAKNERAVRSECTLLCGPKCARMSKMEVSGWRRRESTTVLEGFGHEDSDRLQETEGKSILSFSHRPSESSVFP